MEFTCKSKELKDAIGVVEKAIAAKSSLPVLENVFLELSDGVLKLRGNNLEIGIENNLPINQVQANGSVLLKAKTLSGIISKLDDEFITLKSDEQNKVSIKSGKVDLAILGNKVDEYPVFPEVESGQHLSLTVDALRDLISHTLIAVSYDETKQFLNGILVRNEQDNLVFVSTDGYRLALKKQGIVPLDDQFSSIVPHKAFSELNRILQNEAGDKKVQIIISAGQVSFRMDNFLLISRLIQGQFPDYNQVIPKETANSFKISKQAFMAASERASIIASASNNVVRFSFDNDNMVLQANAKGLGDFKEDVPISRLSGSDSAKIAFNIRLILDVLKTVSVNDLIISFNNELSPCKMTIENDDSFCYIIMPIRTTDYQD